MSALTPLINQEFTHTARTLLAVRIDRESTRKLVKLSERNRGSAESSENSQQLTLSDKIAAFKHQGNDQMIQLLSESTRDHLNQTPFIEAALKADGIWFNSLAPLLGVLGDPYLCQHDNGSVHTRNCVEDLFVHAGLREPDLNGKRRDVCSRRNIHRLQQIHGLKGDDITHCLIRAVDSACLSPHVDENNPYRAAYNQARENPTERPCHLGEGSVHPDSRFYRGSVGHIAAAELLLTRLWDIARIHHTSAMF